MKTIYDDYHSRVTVENDGELITIRQYLGNDLIGEIIMYDDEAKILLDYLDKEMAK